MAVGTLKAAALRRSLVVLSWLASFAKTALLPVDLDY